MPACIIDGKSVEFTPGENLVEVAKRAGVEVPVFCYHPGLSVVAQCRMCAVEIEKMPKIQTACSTKAAEGMVVHTQSAKVKQARESVMEFLLVNHPLDCPICDKAGECDLQDNSYKHGSANMRSAEDRRTYMDLDMGPVIKKNMNRCIHCTRCIRFGDEVAKVREMVALQRGNNIEITTIDGRSLETDYAGNYSDICPTGSLTLKDFRYKKRAWFLKKTPTVCEGCSRGCNMEIQQDAGVIYRCIPRENKEINQFWMCDEGRFNYHYLQDESRITTPLTQGNTTTWASAMDVLRDQTVSRKTLVLVGSDLTLEELKAIQGAFSKASGVTGIAHFGTTGVKSTKEDGAEDALLKMKSKTSNLAGAEKLGISGFSGIPAGTERVVVFRGGRAELPTELSKINPSQLIGIGVFLADEVKGWSTILPSLGFAEKDGTVINFQGKEQLFRRAVPGPRMCKPVSEIVMSWLHQKPVFQPAMVGNMGAR